MKPFIPLAFLLLAGPASAAMTVTYYSSTPVVIPDADLSGVVQTFHVSSSGLASIDSIEVQLNVSGGWGGDFYAYLHHNGIISVLVNRVGRSAVLPDGSPASGMNVTLTSLAALDIHLTGGALNGTFQADGRDVHPLSSLDTSPRGALLSQFHGSAPDGNWTLFIADVAAGDEGTLLNWSMRFTGQAVPEPTQFILLGISSVPLLLRRSRKRIPPSI